MVFSSRFSKFGKGENLSTHMDSIETLSIYYFLDGILKKNVSLVNNELSLTKEEVNLPYNEVIPITNYLITRIDKNIGIIPNVK